jgi:DNA-directed RNA polymerase subunit beta'
LYARNVHKIRELGEELAYLNGHNMGPNDFALKNSKEINSMLDAEDAKLRKMSPEKAKAHLLGVFSKTTGMVMQNKNNIISQALSKGRGNPEGATRIAGSTVYAVDMKSEPYPFLIKNSLSGGLAGHEQYVSGGQARYASVQAAVSTSEPGAMGKVLIANSEDIKISKKDCGTKNGIMSDVSTSDPLGRYEAGTNKLIDEQYLKSLRAMRKKKVKVRSPITCVSKHGICAMCMGKNSSGNLPSVGHNVGIEAAQSMSEKATQLILSAKHNVAGKTSSEIPTGFQAAKILLNSTEKFKGKAAVASTGGKVKSINRLSTGGFNINIGGVDHITSQHVAPKVAVGSMVDKGDILTNGIASTKDIVMHRGILEGRKYLSDELDKVHGGSIDKRNFEVISRGYLDLVKPASGGNDNLKTYDAFVPTISGTHMKNMSTNDKQITKKYLAEPALHFSPGKQITNKVANHLKNNGVNSVQVSHTPLDYKPVFKTYEQRPLFGKSIWQQMNYRGIKKGLTESLLHGKDEDTSQIQSDRAKFTLGIL